MCKNKYGCFSVGFCNISFDHFHSNVRFMGSSGLKHNVQCCVDVTRYVITMLIIAQRSDCMCIHVINARSVLHNVLE